jgi:hypothetical protein
LIAGIVVDTGAVAFLYKHDTRAAAYAPHLNGRLLLISLACRV